MPAVRAGRPILIGLALAWVVAGLVGAYSYAENYNLDRGFPTPKRLAGARAGRLTTAHFFSRALHRRADYLVYVPAACTPPRHCPAFYLLHGSPGRPIAYTVIAHIEVVLDNLISQGRVPPMLLVFPDGRIGASTFSDSEWADTRAGHYNSYVVDVVRDVDRRFWAIRSREARAIAGFSAGAYGAINVALHHLRVFASVEVWSGYFRQTRSGVFAHATPALLAANSPLEYVASLRGQLRHLPLKVFMYVGRGDRAHTQIAPMAHALRAAGAHVRYAIYRGGHDWELWNGHLVQMLILAGHDLSEPARGALRRLRPHRRHHPRHSGRHRHGGRHLRLSVQHRYRRRGP